jgi:hypothetical protein
MNYVTSESAQVTTIVEVLMTCECSRLFFMRMSALQQLPDRRAFVQDSDCEAYRLWDIEECSYEIQSTNNQEHAKKN